LCNLQEQLHAAAAAAATAFITLKTAKNESHSPLLSENHSSDPKSLGKK